MRKWKEWSFAKDDFGQSYYVELWRRLEAAAPEGAVAPEDQPLAVALRATDGRDAVLVGATSRLLHCHFNVDPLSDRRVFMMSRDARSPRRALEEG